MKARLERRIFELKRPLATAHGLVRSRESLILELTDSGQSGFGEAAPLPSYDGGDIELCDAALRERLERIGAMDPTDPAALTNATGRDLPPQARAALDTAARDLAARLSGKPLWSELGARSSKPVEVSALLTHSDPIDAHHEARQLSEFGFRTIKMKVGLDQDRRLVESIREAVGEEVALRLDANGRWNVDEALAQLTDIADAMPELCEQPCSGIEAMRELRARSPVPIALDEDATAPLALSAPPAADSVCLKLQACGGLDRMVEAARSARDAGMEVFIGSTLDGPVSVAASLHAACAINADRACGLATLDALVGLEGVLPVVDGTIEPPGREGIGLGPDGSEC